VRLAAVTMLCCFAQAHGAARSPQLKLGRAQQDMENGLGAALALLSPTGKAALLANQEQYKSYALAECKLEKAEPPAGERIAVTIPECLAKHDKDRADEIAGSILKAAHSHFSRLQPFASAQPNLQTMAIFHPSGARPGQQFKSTARSTRGGGSLT